MKTEIAGNGYFTPDDYDAECVEFSHCDICTEKMDVKKNVHGPTGMAEAMGKMGHKHDVVTCPFRHELWHIQAYKLREEARQTVSKRIENLLLKEMKEVIANRQPTK